MDLYSISQPKNCLGCQGPSFVLQVYCKNNFLEAILNHPLVFSFPRNNKPPLRPRNKAPHPVVLLWDTKTLHLKENCKEMVPISGNQGGLINPRVFFQIVRQGGVYYSIRMGGAGGWVGGG